MRLLSFVTCTLTLVAPLACGGSSFEDAPANTSGNAGASTAGSAGGGGKASTGGAGGSTQGGSSGGPAGSTAAGTAGAAGQSGGAAGSTSGGTAGAAGAAVGGAAGAAGGGGLGPAGAAGAGGAVTAGAGGVPAAGAGGVIGSGGAGAAGAAGQAGQAQAGQGGQGQAGQAGGGGSGGFGPGYCDPLAPFDTVEAMPAPINDPNTDNAHGDFTAWMSPSQSFIAWGRWDNSDIFATSKSAVTQQWGVPDDLKGSGSAGYDFFPSLLPDLKTMYFTSDRDGPAAYRQYVTTRANIGENFGNVQYVEIPGRKATDREFGGHITNDGTALYFASTRASAANAVWNPKQLDLYVLQGVGTAAASVQSLDAVNLPGVDDSYPAISPDQRVLYFGSNRANMGHDIYVATRSGPQAPFSAPVLAPGLQTPNGDYPSWISGDYCTLLFHRTTGTKSVIYQATRTPG